MNDLSRTNELLVKELQELRKEHYALKAFYENDITERKIVEQALEVSKEKYRLLLENSILGILAFDIETLRCSFSNPAACRLFGYSEEEIIRFNITDFHPKDSIEKVMGEFESQWRGEKLISNALPCLRKDGTIFYADIAGYSTTLNERNCSIGFIMDVTDRKQTEDSLLQTRLFLDSIIEHIPNSMWISDEYGTMIRLNQACRDNLHLKDDEVIGKYNIFADNLIEEQGFMPMVKDVFEKGFTAHFIIQYDTSAVKNLKLEQTIKVFLEVHISPIVNSQGKVTNAIIQHNDITERKQTEEKLRESEKRIQKKLSNLLAPESDISELALEDIINTEAIQSMMEEFYKITKIPVAIIDMEGKVLVDPGWQDLCTKFHRVHPETLANCIECDTLLTKGVPPGTFKSYLCKNSLWDNATPLIIGGRHVGNLFTGQFFYEGEKPDDEIFRKQAARYGFDEKEYMDAVSRVPIWSREVIHDALAFFVTLANMISSLSHANLGLAKVLEQHRLAKEAVQATRDYLDKIINSVASPIFVKDDEHKFTLVNEAFCSLLGVRKEEIIGTNGFERFPEDQFDIFIAKDQEVFNTGKENVNEEFLTDGQGKVRIIITRKTLYTDTSNNKFLVGIINDITESKQAEEALKKSEERFRDLFNLGNEGLILLTMDGEIAEVNQLFAQMHGYTVEEIKHLGIKDLDVLGEDSFDGRAELMKRIFAGEVVRFEVEHYHKDGHSIFMSNTVSLITIEKQQYFLAFHQDITEHKQMEDALQNSEEKYSKAFLMSPYAVIITQPEDGKFIEINDAFTSITGFTREETIADSSIGLNLWVDLEVRKIIVSDLLEGKEVKEKEFQFRKKNGEIMTGLFSAQIIHLNNKRLILSSINDITDRKLAENKIHEKDVQFRKLSANLPDLIYQFTRRPDGTYYVPIASEGIKNIFGCSPEDVVDDFAPIGRVIYPEDSERVINDIEYSAKNLTYFTCEFRVQIPGKPIQWIFSRSTPEKLADGSITWYGFNANITEIKQTEFELIRAKEKAEESDRLKSAFLANMSHEIRTPMNGILGFSELLTIPHLTGEEQQEYISMIERSGKRMLNIINDIVDISKIESGQMDISLSETNINEQIEFMYNFFTPEIEKKGLQLVYKTPLPPNESIIKTDREKIYAILTNLVNNAIKYTSTGSIEFGYEKKGKYLEFYVKDTGIGIREDQEEIIFERFRQGDDLNKQFTEGTGLGLSIAKGNVELLGGKMWLESEFGKGSAFYFTLPYNVALESKTGSTKVSSEITPEHHVKNLKILIAEDDQTSLSFLSRVLNMFCREILTAGTGVEAVEACRNHPDIDLVLMDVTMPDLNGYEATRQIRGFNQDVIIIAQTAYAMADDRKKALETGCNDYISKPIRIDALKELIKKHFSK